jgi:hypothetical protein
MPRTAYLRGVPLQIQLQGFLVSGARLEIIPAPNCEGFRSGASRIRTRARTKETLVGIVSRILRFQATNGSARPWVHTFDLPHDR